VRFLIDMPLPPVLAAWLTDQGHDAVHAVDLGLQRAPDVVIMERAKQEARTIVTADLDYPHLLVLARATEPSLILFRGGDWSEAEAWSMVSDPLGSDTMLRPNRGPPCSGPAGVRPRGSDTPSLDATALTPRLRIDIRRHDQPSHPATVWARCVSCLSGVSPRRRQPHAIATAEEFFYGHSNHARASSHRRRW